MTKLEKIQKYSYIGKTLDKLDCGIINIDIDTLTFCLKRLKDAAIVDTYFVEGIPVKEDLDDWEFDWKLEREKGCTIMQLYAIEDERLQGLVSTRIRNDIQAIEISLIESAPINNSHNIKCIEKEYEGVGGHLFAEAIRQSYEAGFEGFVVFISKSNLIHYYFEKLGATLVNSKTRLMCIDERSAKVIYEKYFKKSY